MGRGQQQGVGNALIAAVAGVAGQLAQLMDHFTDLVRLVAFPPRPPPGGQQLAECLLLLDHQRTGAVQRCEEAGVKLPASGRLLGHRKRRKMTLILDLDETLIHSAPHPMDPVRTHGGTVVKHDLRVDIRTNHGPPKTFLVWKRPHLDVFLREVSRLYEVVVFTAGQQRYASPLIDLVDLNCVIRRRFFRDACQSAGNGKYVKDLSLVCGEHYPERCVIIDNSPCAYSSTCPDNAIPIKGFFGNDPADDALLGLLPLLNALNAVRDVRSVLRLRTDPRSLDMLKTHRDNATAAPGGAPDGAAAKRRGGKGGKMRGCGVAGSSSPLIKTKVP